MDISQVDYQTSKYYMCASDSKNCAGNFYGTCKLHAHLFVAKCLNPLNEHQTIGVFLVPYSESNN